MTTFLPRQPLQDDAIPLAESITTRDGRVINEIPVSKGQSIHCSFVAYNRFDSLSYKYFYGFVADVNVIRLPSVWGPDAHEWRPTRFLEDKIESSGPSIGMLSNL